MKMNTYIIVNKKAALAEAYRKTLKQAFGGDLQVHLTPAWQRGYDFDLHIDTKPPLRLAVETKTRITTRNQALQIIFQLRRHRGEKTGAMVFADWIPEPVAEEFRKAGVFFMDAQGNVFFKKPPQIMLDIRGRKPERPMKV